MLLKYRKYYCLMLAFFFTITAWTQNQSPLFNITFGQAPTDNISISGPPLNIGFTALPYTTNICPSPGSYTVVSGITKSCFSNKWIPLLSDNTPLPDNNGYMMLINDMAYSSPKIIFQGTVTEICPQVNYQFSAAIMNIDTPRTTSCFRFSSLTLQVEDNMGNVIGSTTTGDIQFATYNQGWHFTKYGVNFMLPIGATGVVVKIIDEAKALTTCTNGLAIDDIKVVVTGASANIGFDSAQQGEWVKTVCYLDNKSFTMRGFVDTGLVNPAVQWQQSTDDGLNWSDILGATGYLYTRSFPLVDTFLFRLRAFDSTHIANPECGITSDLLKVQVDGPPKNYTLSNNSPICSGEDLQFHAAGAPSFIWTGPNGFFDNISSPHIFHSSTQDSGMYYVDVFSLGGCRVKDSTHVTIIGNDIKAGPDTSLCKGGKVRLEATSGNTYLWSPANGLSATDIRNPFARPEETTEYVVKVTDNSGCTDTAHVTVTILNKNEVKAIISGNEYLCRSFDSVSFVSKSLGDINKWSWDFGNGQTSSLEKPLVQRYQIPPGTSIYNVMLTVTDTMGCIDITYHSLKVVDNCYIAVPTAFTPNNDGLNDYLYPVNAYKATHLLFQVFNRSGQLVFKTNTRNIKWDGKINGVDQPTGVYVWILNYDDAAGKKNDIRGTTLLIR